jgi:hypothetical protein
LLVAGSVASLAADVAVAEPALIGRMIAAWPSFALTASFELLTRQARRGAAGEDAQGRRARQPPLVKPAAAGHGRLLDCALRVSLGMAGTTAVQALSCNGKLGDGRWPTVARVDSAQRAWRLPVPTAAVSGGVGWSRTPTRLMPSKVCMHKNRDRPQMTGSRCTVWALTGSASQCERHWSARPGLPAAY